MTLTPEGRIELAVASDGCACCAVDTSTTATDASALAVDATSTAVASYGVAGMTCGNCVGHVTEELSALAGVDAVDVALVAGGVSTVTVRSVSPVSPDVIAAAVAEAGYQVVER